jgi:hypothetical protein
MSTLVLGYWHVVHPDTRVVVDGTEVQQHALALGRHLVRQLELALIPACAMKASVADPATLAFRREGNADFERPPRHVRGDPVAEGIIKGKTPWSIQR